jgi:small subunit ribosomal protein S5
MDKEQETKKAEGAVAVKAAAPTTAAKTSPAPTTGAPRGRNTGGPQGRGRTGGPQGGRGGPRRGRRRPERPRSEFEHKIVSIRRVTRVVSGGRRFSFSVGIVAGDKKGRVGVGVGKASDTALAIDKALRNAEKNMTKIKISKNGSIAHEVDTKYASSRVLIMPAPARGVIAGSSVRTVLELAGLKDVGAKIFSRSKNKINNARAAVQALSSLK